MADGGGNSAAMGIKMVTGWDDAYAAVDTIVPFKSESISHAFNRVENTNLNGTGGQPASGQGNEVVQGDTVHALDYNNFDSIFELAFGDVAARVFTIAESLTKMCYIEIDKDIERWRYGPAKITKLAVSGSASSDEPLELTITWSVRTRTRVATAFPALSPAAENLIVFPHLTFRVGDQGDALAAGDVMGLGDFTFEFDRQLVTDDYDSVNKRQILEPIENGRRVVTMQTLFTRYNATTKQLIDWRDSDTALQADLLFAGGGEQHKIELPNLRADEGFDVPIDGGDRLQVEGSMRAHPSVAGNPMYVGNECKVTFA